MKVDLLMHLFQQPDAGSGPHANGARLGSYRAMVYGALDQAPGGSPPQGPGAPTYQGYALSSLDRWFFRNPITAKGAARPVAVHRVLRRCCTLCAFRCLAPAAALTAHHRKALHEHGPVFGCQFVPIPLAGIGDEAAHLGVMLRAGCPGEGGP